MCMTKKGFPKTSNEIISKFFKSAENALRSASERKPVQGEGPFGESIQLLAYQLATAQEQPTEGLELGAEAQEQLMSVFRDDVDDPTSETVITSLTVCLYGCFVELYNDEDFRYVYRYGLRHIKNQKQIESFLRRALVFLAATRQDDPRNIMLEVRSQIQYLGAPLFAPTTFIDAGKEFHVDIESVVQEEEFRLADALIRHPQYLEEAISGRPFFPTYESLRVWGPDVLLKKMLKTCRTAVYRDAQQEIDAEFSVSEAVKKVQKIFSKEQFRTNKDTVLQVRLQDLEDPPPGEPIDPVIFEMIPQKLRMGLLSSVAYTTKTKKIEIIFLGGPRIGRSGILVKTDTGGILMDFGLSVANHRVPEWVPELEMIDTVLVSHGHLDHLGGLPILFDDFDGKWCSVGPTGGIVKLLLDDALKVGTPFPPRRNDPLDLVSRFRSENIEKVTRAQVQLEYGKSSEVGPGIVVTPIDASHIPGSAMFEIDVEGIKILYTGDFNIDKSVLFQGADPPTDSDYVIFDGTYWGREDFDRAKVKDLISNTIASHGPVIIPSFAVGRSQEVLLILEELGITKNRNVMVTGLAERVAKFVGVKGHWRSMKKNKMHLDEDDVLVSGGGMMSGGLARHHFREQRENPKAAVILCGYLAPRTAGWNLLHGYEPHKCRVEMARLSAHSSSSNLQEFISKCKGKRIMVHTPITKKPKGIMVPDYRERITIKV